MPATVQPSTSLCRGCGRSRDSRWCEVVRPALLCNTRQALPTSATSHNACIVLLSTTGIRFAAAYDQVLNQILTDTVLDLAKAPDIVDRHFLDRTAEATSSGLKTFTGWPTQDRQPL